MSKKHKFEVKKIQIILMVFVTFHNIDYWLAVILQRRFMTDPRCPNY